MRREPTLPSRVWVCSCSDGLRYLIALAAALVVVACGAGDGAGLGEEAGASPPLAWPEPLAWRDHGVHPLGSAGQTPLIHIAIPPGALSVVLRAAPASGVAEPKACFRFADLHTDSGAEWVAAASSGPEGGRCANCLQRVEAQRGFAALVLPGPGLTLQGVTSVDVRVAMRECSTGVAVAPGQLGMATAQVRVDSTVRTAEPKPPAVLEVVVVHLGPAAQLPSAVAWKALWGRTRQVFAAAGIEVVERAVLTVPELAGVAVAPLTLGPEHSAAIDALQGAMDALLASQLAAQQGQSSLPAQQIALLERTLVVVSAPCLRMEDPLQPGATALRGHVTRMPGGVRVAGVASLTLLGASNCTSGKVASDPVLLGNVLAHELGHQLGLYHSDNSQAGGVAGDLMTSRIAEVDGAGLAFSAQQTAAMRKHPSVYGR